MAMVTGANQGMGFCTAEAGPDDFSDPPCGQSLRIADPLAPLLTLARAPPSQALAQKGCTVHLVCRNKERGETAQKAIVEKTGNKDVHLLVADMSSISEARTRSKAPGRATDP